MRRRRDKVLRGVRPNIGIEAEYRRELLAMIDEMHRSIIYWVSAAYRDSDPHMARDASPANMLRNAIKRMASRWLRRFAEAAPRLAKYFSIQASQRSTGALKKILKDAGFSVEFKISRSVNDILQATINENVALIKSIPQQWLAQVEVHVMQSVKEGRKLDELTRTLSSQYGVTRKRAALIARDQNNKATAAITRQRQIEAKIEEAIWVHSTAGKEPRPTHVAAGARQQRYNVSEGWFDPHEKRYIWPGTLINCRCFCRPVLKGLE